jgi:hypothetical protein
MPNLLVEFLTVDVIINLSVVIFSTTMYVMEIAHFISNIYENIIHSLL